MALFVAGSQHNRRKTETCVFVVGCKSEMKAAGPGYKKAVLCTAQGNIHTTKAQKDYILNTETFALEFLS